jgi:hypothetical protein
MNLIENSYEGMRCIQYGDEGATFVPVCEKCGKFVKPDPMITFTYDGPPLEPNGTCKKCGRVAMLFEGYI